MSLVIYGIVYWRQQLLVKVWVDSSMLKVRFSFVSRGVILNHSGDHFAIIIVLENGVAAVKLSS